MSKFLQQVHKRMGKKRMQFVSNIEDHDVMIVDLKDGYVNPFQNEYSWIYGNDWESPLYVVFDDLKHWLDCVVYDPEHWEIMTGNKFTK